MPLNEVHLKMDYGDEILVIAAEASSVLYAERLLELWQSQNKKIKAYGVGSLRMQAMGFECLGRAEEMAVVGIAEVLTHYKLIKSVYNSVLERVRARPPRVALLLDYPGFNLRLAQDLKKLNIPVVYYISPQVWAWKKNRVKIIQKTVDKMLVLLPFEEKFYQDHQVNVEFVGHPLLDEIKEEFLSKESRREYRHRFGIVDDDFVLAVMPGSRESELKNHMPVLLEVARKFMMTDKPKSKKIIFPLAPTLRKEQLLEHLKGFDSPYIILTGEPFDMLKSADLAVGSSGTATLFVGLMEIPMVVMYKMNWLTTIIAKKLVGHIKMVALPNLIFGREVMPERILDQATPENLWQVSKSLIESPEKRLQMVNELKELKNRLGCRGATERVAKTLDEYLR